MACNKTKHWNLLAQVAVLALMLATCRLVSAQVRSEIEDGQAQPTVSDELAIRQGDLADQFGRLEKLMLRMAEFDQSSNPRRAETLKEAYATAKEQDVRLQLDSVVRLLNQDQFRRAITNQESVLKDLHALLRVLESENRGDRLKDDQTRVREYIKEVERLQRMQRSVRGRTEGGLDHEQAAREQDQVTRRAQALDEQIQQDEGPRRGGDSQQEAETESNSAGGSPENDTEKGDASEADADESDSATPAGQPSEGRPSEGEPSEGKPSEGAPSEDQPPSDSQGEGSDGAPPQEGQPSQPGKPSEGKSEQGSEQGQPSSQPSGSGEGDSAETEPSEAFPGQQKIQQAQQRMQEARAALEKAQRDQAVEEQKEAAKKLAEAKAELEEILRQMREEEIERTLAQLEARFQKMLEMQLRVNDRTMQLDERGSTSDDRVLEVEASKLSFQEKRIVVEADKALTLLREEGSSIAFPETVGQMRDDMQEVVDRLARARVGVITQGLEEEIVQTLEEMIEALQIAQQEQEERKSQQQQSAQASPGDMPLVNAIAELRMIKSLQIRVNKRTNRYAQMLDEIDDPAGQAADEELIDGLRRLAERELRVQEITHDLAIGKNK